MRAPQDILLALILVECGLASREMVKKLRRKQLQLGQQRGKTPPLGQFLTQEKIVSPRQYLALRDIVLRCQTQCLGCRRPFSVLPAKRAGRRRCLRCGTMTPTPVLDLSAFDTKQSDRKRLISNSSGHRHPAAKGAGIGRVDDRGQPIPDFIGPYKIVDYIATGGMGVIYRAADPNGGPEMALKVLRKDCTGDLIERFKREGEAEARLKHPAIVEVYDLGEDDGTNFFTMELIDGQPFDEYLKKKPALKDVLPLLAQISHGLDYAHENGLIHRDMKPQNILITKDGRAKLTDFGLARDLGQSSLSNDGDIIGTPLYMAPEQINSKIGKIDRRTDVFALGVILYQILTEKLPFPARNLNELQQKLLKEPPKAPSSIDVNVPRELEGICLKALEKQPKLRYQTAEDFGLDLEKWLRGESIPVFKPSGTMSISLDARFKADLTRTPTLIILALVIAIILVVLTALIIFTLKDGEDPKLAQRSQAFVTNQETIQAGIEKGFEDVKQRWNEAQSMRGNRPEKAIELLQKTLTRIAELSELIAKKEGDVLKARSQQRRLDQLARIQLAELLAERASPDDLAEAPKLLKPLLKDPYFPISGQLLSAQLLLKQGNTEKALRLFQTIYESRAESGQVSKDRSAGPAATRQEALLALYGRGQALLKLNRPRFALEDFEQLDKIFESNGPSPRLSRHAAQYYLAKAQLAIGENQSALRILRKVRQNSRGQVWPERQEALATIVVLEIENEQWKAARQSLEELSLNAKNDLDFKRLTGRLALREKKYKRALELFNQVLLRAPVPLASDHAFRAEARLGEKAFGMDLATLKVILRDLDSALRLDPKESPAKLFRARMRYLSGDDRGARDDLEDLVREPGRLNKAQRFERDIMALHIVRSTSNRESAFNKVKELMKSYEEESQSDPYIRQNLDVELRELDMIINEKATGLSLSPSFPERNSSARLLRLSAKLEINQSGRETAESLLTKALQYNPNDRLSRALLKSLNPDLAAQSELSLPLQIPDLEGPFADHWDPLREALFFRKLASKVAPKDGTLAKKLRLWAANLLGAQDHGLILR